jgi:leucyl-tRNA synthetase
MQKYDHAKIEKKWQAEWERTNAFAAKDYEGQKNYLLIEFPYPSGDGLHVGHIRSWTAMDVVARKHRAEGKNVLYPIGWDAFGLPAENYAIKTGIHPKINTKQNTDNFRRQIKSIGISFDWSREIDTTDPGYYKWTQWIFLQLFKKGLAYKTKTLINWCPFDKVTLANEEVVDGACERCGTLVEKREKEQWMLAITKYAERLYDDLDTVDYITAAKVGQRNWIGPSQGAEIEFPVANSDKKIKVFTTRPDTLFGTTYMVLAPEHPLVAELAEKTLNKSEVLAYAKEAMAKSEIERSAEGKEKTGIELQGIKAINPATKEEIPVFIADYVLGGYGTGAIMAVPAHDERDFEFAQKFNLPIRQVIEPTYTQTTEPGKVREGEPFDHREAIIAIVKHWKDDTYIALKWKQVAWGTFITGGIEKGQTPEEAAKMELEQEVGYTDAKFVKDFGVVHGKFYHVPKKTNRNAHAHVLYLELQSDARKPVAVEEQEIHEVLWLSADELKKFLTPDTHQHGLRMLLGEQELYTSYGTLVNSGQFDRMESEEAMQKITEFVGGAMVTTYKLRDWVFGRQRYWGEPIPLVHCTNDGWVPVPESELPVLLPETDTFLPGVEGESPLANMTDWVNTKCPKCGGTATRETDVMPQWAGSSWYYLRYADPRNDKEFASQKKLDYWTPVDWYNGGMEHTTLHLLYSRFWHKALFDLGLVPTSEPYLKRTSHGLILAEDGSKMSKSKGNTVSPDTLVETFGADSLRLYEMFIGPFDQPVAWNTASVMGVRRFLERVWNMQEKVADVAVSIETETLLHQTIEKVTKDIEALKMNTAVSALMILSNHLVELKEIPKLAYGPFLKLLNPFAPHMASEIAARAGYPGGALDSWPSFDPSKVVSAIVSVVVQVNGKVRATVELSPGASEEEALQAARSNENVMKWLKAGVEKRAVYVAGKIINFVVG